MWRRLRIPPHPTHAQYPQENQWNKEFIYLHFQMGNPKNKEKRKQNNNIEIKILLFWSLPLRYQNDFHLWRNLHLWMQEETIWEEWRTWERNKDAEKARETRERHRQVGLDERSTANLRLWVCGCGCLVLVWF